MPGSQNRTFPSALMLYSFILLSLIYFIGIFLQSQLLLNHDVAWFLDAATRLMAGGHYYQNFFENNPPLILYLSIPPVLLHTYLGIHLIISLRLYIFLIGSASLVLCAKLSSSRLFLLTLASLFFIAPLYDFGQREHLAFLLTTPYFLLVIARLKSQPLPRHLTLMVGLLASIGFALKPFFLIPLLYVESYYCWQQKTIWGWLRSEAVTILIFLLSYFFFILYFHPDYVQIVAPFAAHWQLASVALPWRLILTYPSVIFCLTPWLFYLFAQPTDTVTYHILLLALYGFWCSFFIQQNLFSYHLYPALSYAILISVLLYQDALLHLTKERMIRLSLYTFILLELIIYTMPTLWTFITLHKPFFFSFFTLQLAWIIFYFPSGSILKKLPTLMLLPLSLTLFAIPSTTLYMNYLQKMDAKKKTIPLITFLQAHAQQKKIYFFTTNIPDVYPAIQMCRNIQSASRFSAFWMLPGMIKSKGLSTQLTQDKKFLINMIAQDLITQRPDLILIDVTPEKNQLFEISLKNHTLSTTVIPFDYLAYFSKNLSFQRAWKAYHYREKLVIPSIFSTSRTFNIYQRNPT